MSFFTLITPVSRLYKALKTIDYGLWSAVLVTLLFPSIYQMVRINYLGQLPANDGINIASQLSWVSLIYEIIYESLFLPLYFLLGKSIHKIGELENKLRTGLIGIMIIYISLSIVLIFFAKDFVLFISQDNALIDNTVSYIQIEGIAYIFSTLYRFMALVILLIGKEKYIYLTLILQMIISILLDTFLISDIKYSFNIGVNGIAISNIIVNIILTALTILLLRREAINILSKKSISFKWLTEWFKIGRYVGVESLIRNFVFIIIILKMINEISEQGNYWIANNFIWGWLLLPARALGEVIKKEVGENRKNLLTKSFGYFSLASIFILIWILSMPFWKIFMQFVLNVQDVDSVYNIVYTQSIFYLFFIISNNIINSIFLGLGRTDYIFIQSLIINICYYGTVYLLYSNSLFIPSINSISYMFGGGLLLHFISSCILYLRLLRVDKIVR